MERDLCFLGPDLCFLSISADCCFPDHQRRRQRRRRTQRNGRNKQTEGNPSLAQEYLCLLVQGRFFLAQRSSVVGHLRRKDIGKEWMFVVDETLYCPSPVHTYYVLVTHRECPGKITDWIFRESCKGSFFYPWFYFELNWYKCRRLVLYRGFLIIVLLPLIGLFCYFLAIISNRINSIYFFMITVYTIWLWYPT